MLQPAGYRPAGAWVRAGAGLRGAGGSVGMSCVRFALVLRFWRGVLCSIYARRAFPFECFAFIHACFVVLARRLVFDLCPACVSIGMSCVRSRLLFDALRQAERLAGGCVSIPPWVGIAGSAFSMAVRLSGFVGSLRACAFLYGDPDGERKGRGGRSRRRGRVRFCVNILAL